MISIRSDAREAVSARDAFTKLSTAMADDPSRFAAAANDTALARAAMSEAGIDAPEGVEIRLLRNDDRVFHFAIPANPNAELGEESIGSVAGGVKIVGGVNLSTLSSFILCFSTVACSK